MYPPYRFVSSFSTTCSLLAKKKMPPKKAIVEKKNLLGRPSNNLKIGIVGLFLTLNLFLTLTHLLRSPKCRKIVLLQRSIRDKCPFLRFSLYKKWTYIIQDLANAANFPYATINPEEARIPVPDTRFEWLCNVYKPASRVPAFLTCIDIAGLTAVSFSYSAYSFF